MHHAGGHDPQPRVLEAGVDLADHVARDRVGLDDGKRSFNCHAASFVSEF
jgi:hypothetical protein